MQTSTISKNKDNSRTITITTTKIYYIPDGIDLTESHSFNCLTMISKSNDNNTNHCTNDDCDNCVLSSESNYKLYKDNLTFSYVM